MFINQLIEVVVLSINQSCDYIVKNVVSLKKNPRIQPEALYFSRPVRFSKPDGSYLCHLLTTIHRIQIIERHFQAINH